MKTDPRCERLLRRTCENFQQMSQFSEDALIFERGEGLQRCDISGKRYFDAMGRIFAAAVGYQHPRAPETTRRQTERMTFAAPLHGIADVTFDFVEKVGAVAPGGLKYVKPFSGGSESTEAAMKFVRQYFRQTGHPGSGGV